MKKVLNLVFSQHCVGFRKKAFTLAEVLITLGIIGVVAALTLPTLIQNYQKHVYVTGAKKAVSVISSMFQREMADEGVSNVLDTNLLQTGCTYPFSLEDGYMRAPGLCVEDGYEVSSSFEDGYGGTSTLEEIIPKYIKVIKTKTCAVGYECESTTYKGYSPGGLDFIDNKLDLNHQSPLMSGNIGPLYQVYSADGTIYYFARSTTGLFIAFDINGKKGPNTYGRDLFCMMHINGNLVGANCSGNYIGNSISPIGYLMNNGWKMDY